MAATKLAMSYLMSFICLTWLSAGTCPIFVVVTEREISCLPNFQPLNLLDDGVTIVSKWDNLYELPEEELQKWDDKELDKKLQEFQKCSESKRSGRKVYFDSPLVIPIFFDYF